MPILPKPPDGYKWVVEETYDVDTEEMISVGILREKSWNENVGVDWIPYNEEGAGGIMTIIILFLSKYIKERLWRSKDE